MNIGNLLKKVAGSLLGQIPGVGPLLEEFIRRR